MTTDRQNDKRILEMLDQDPKEGMTLIVKHYTGLIWKVSSLHLSDPEDIKECTNDTFAEFYFQKDRFDPERASLAVYLTAIARNLSISRYRRERIRQMERLSEDCPVTDYELDLAEARTDLKQALASLNPDELRIIQMKYYDGMTVQEIAESLDLPYETVKKRHQRSIGKLRHALLIMLLILTFALITACSYKLLVHYNIIPDFLNIWIPGLTDETDLDNADDNANPSTKPLNIWIPEQIQTDDAETAELPPASSASSNTSSEASTSGMVPAFSYLPGYGVNWTPEEQFYTLKESVMTENAYISFQLIKAVYVNQSLRLEIVETSKTAPFNDITPLFADTLNWGDYVLTCNEKKWECTERSSEVMDAYTRKCIFLYDNVDLPSEDIEDLIWSVNVFRTPQTDPVTFTLNHAETASVENYACQIEKYGGLLAIPRLENGSLIVELHPLNTDDTFRTLPGLIRDLFGSGYASSLIAVCQDGSELTGTCIRYNPSQSIQYFEWNFGPAAPGTYTIHIPYVYQKASLPEDFSLPVNLPGYSGEKEIQTIPGGNIWIKNCMEEETTDSGKSWKISLGFSTADKEHPFSKLYLNCTCRLRPEYKELYPNLFSGLDEYTVNGFSMLESDPSTGTMNYLVTVNEEQFDASVCHLVPQTSMPGNITFLWNQSFDLTFTVK